MTTPKDISNFITQKQILYNLLIMLPLSLYVIYFGGQFPSSKIFYLPVVLLLSSFGVQQLRILFITKKEIQHLEDLLQKKDDKLLHTLLQFPIRQSIVIAFAWVAIGFFIFLFLSFLVPLTGYLVSSIIVSVLVGGLYTGTVTYFISERSIFEILSRSYLKSHQIDKSQNLLLGETGRKILMLISVTMIPFAVLGFFVILAGNFQIEFSNLTFHFSILVALLAFAIAIVVYENFLPTKQGIFRIAQTIENLEKGKLSNQNLFMNMGSELGFATQNLNIFRIHFRNIISAVLDTSADLGDLSADISQSMEKISNAGKQQANSIKEVFLAITEISLIFQEATEHSQESLQAALRTAKNSRQGEELLLHIVKEMQEIVAKIVLVQEVAGQTNLLSLNAAIEAARSGQHGKGFAVVAAEISSLAETSNEAAKEITELVYNTLKHSETAKNIFTAIVPKVEENVQLLQEIANWGQEQQFAINQIKNNIDQLDGIADDNAHTSSSVAQIADELKVFSQQLIEQVKFFELQNDEQDDEESKQF